MFKLLVILFVSKLYAVPMYSYILAYRTLYGFQKFGVHNKFGGVHLYIVDGIFRVL